MTASAHLDELRLQVRALPECPGVYFWKDSSGRTLYIGKAINLRSRVTSYFATARTDRRTRELLSKARSVDYEVTATELEALFKESALIKQALPRYNRALRSPKRGHYLKFDGAREHPFMEKTRQQEADNSLYFGPFPSGAVLRETTMFLHDVLPLRKCTAVKPRCKPCVYYQMRKCAAPYIDEEHRQRHEDAIQQLFSLLDGRGDRVRAWLEAKRDRLSEQLLFERAADVQARIDMLGDLLRKQAILDAAIHCRCVLIYQDVDNSQTGQLLLVAHGNVVSVRSGSTGDAAAVERWIRAHFAVMQAAACQENEIDSALVLQRWLAVKRRTVRWVSIPQDASPADLNDRVRYVLGTTNQPTSPEATVPATA